MSARLVPSLLAGLALASCAAAGSPSLAGEGREEVRAPIVRVALRVTGARPPEYFADVTSALPDGCTHFARFGVRREGDVVLVEVFNTVPTDPTLMCTMIYGEHESAVPLGHDFRPGARYTLDVNGARQELVAK